MIPSPALTDTRARFRGFRDASHYLTLATKALELPPPLPRWVWREYRAIFGGKMWLPRGGGPVRIIEVGKI